MTKSNTVAKKCTNKRCIGGFERVRGQDYEVPCLSCADDLEIPVPAKQQLEEDDLRAQKYEDRELKGE